MSEIKPVAEVYMDDYGTNYATLPKDFPAGGKLYGKSAIAQARAEMKELCAQECESMSAQLSDVPGDAADGARSALLDAADMIRDLYEGE